MKETYQLILDDESITPDSDRIREFIKQRTYQLNETYQHKRKVIKETQSQKNEEDDEILPDTKENIQIETNEDDFIDESGDDGFLNDPPISPSFESSPVKQEKRKRRSSVKSEPSPSTTRKSTTTTTRKRRRYVFCKL